MESQDHVLFRFWVCGLLRRNPDTKYRWVDFKVGTCVAAGQELVWSGCWSWQNWTVHSKRWNCLVCELRLSWWNCPNTQTHRPEKVLWGLDEKPLQTKQRSLTRDQTWHKDSTTAWLGDIYLEWRRQSWDIFRVGARSQEKAIIKMVMPWRRQRC